MLSSAEIDLVRRDPAIPGLAVVFDPDAFVAALRVAVPDAELGRAQIIHMSYKPRAYCRVSYRLDLAGMEVDVDVRACRPEDIASWLKESGWESEPGPLGRGHLVHLVLEQCAILVSAFPNDLKLPGLERLMDAEERERLLSEMLPERPNLWQGELRCLRYRPERRYVAELRGTGQARALLKSYTPKAYVRGKHAALAFQGSESLRLARLLGSRDDACLLAFEWLPGRLLFEVWGATQIDRQVVSATGAALAALHAQNPEGLGRSTRAEEAANLVELASEIGFICPALAARADELSRRLAAKLAAAPVGQCASHGDFSAKQVLVGQPPAAIVDLDWAVQGDPAGDLGNFIAQAERHALQGALSPGRVELLRDALLEGYGRSTDRRLPERIGLYTAVELFRRARFPFRGREPDWPERTERLLERAGALLNRLN